MRRVVRTVLVAAAVAMSPLPAAAGPAVVPDCSELAVTPTGTPLVVWCATAVYSPLTKRIDDIRLWRSTGTGRWVRAAAKNLVANAPPSPPQASPRWAEDRTLYWATSGGLFASTDLGESFTLVSALVTGQQHPVRRVLLSDNGNGVTAAVAGYDPHDIGWAASGQTTVPATGSPGNDLTFVAADRGIGVIAWDPGAGPHRVVGYRCDAGYACGTPWFELPPPQDEWPHQFIGSWRAPGSNRDSYLAVRAGEGYHRVSLWRIGATTTSMRSADALVAPLGGRGDPVVAMAFAGPLTYLRIASAGDRAGTSHDRVYVSRDGTASWRLVVAAATTERGASTGPWRPGVVSFAFVPVLVARAGVLMANVSDGTRYTFRCSTDGGARWRASCT